MATLEILSDFFTTADENPRISKTHVSLYMALLAHWHEQEYENPISVYSWEVMTLAKIAGRSTYHRVLKDLCEYGYVRYRSSFDHSMRSLIFINPIKK